MLKSRSVPRYIVWILDLIGLAILIYLAWYFMSSDRGRAQSPPLGGDNTEAFSARVLEIVDEGTVAVNGSAEPYQILRLQVVEGSQAGQSFEVDYGKRQLAAPGVSVKVGDRILLSVLQKPDGSRQAYFIDFVRTRAMLWLLGVFVASSILLSGWKGVRSMLAMLFSFAVIGWYILPRILMKLPKQVKPMPKQVDTTGVKSQVTPSATIEECWRRCNSTTATDIGRSICVDVCLAGE